MILLCSTAFRCAGTAGRYNGGMPWRVIIRVSLTADTGSVIRNTVIEAGLRPCGVNNTVTGTWESLYADEALAAACITNVMLQLANPAGVAGADPAALLNHIWIYIDEADPDDNPVHQRENP